MGDDGGNLRLRMAPLSQRGLPRRVVPRNDKLNEVGAETRLDDSLAALRRRKTCALEILAGSVSLVGMSASTPVNPDEAGLEVKTYFVRHRNVLLARANFSDLFVDYYLHLSDQKLKPAPEHDGMFKRALAAFTLHCASQPRKVMTAWTMNFQRPLVNFFLAGDNEFGSVMGRIFTENVRQMPEGLLSAEVIHGRGETRRSSVAISTGDPFEAVEGFYAQSEQRAARYFATGDESFAMITEHPDCDLAWLRGLSAEDVARLDETETLTLMETRVERWHCGCNQERMMQVLLPTMMQDPADLFGADQKLEIRCPRCAARHVVTRESMEAFVEAHR